MNNEEKLIEFIEYWTHISHLQTFQDRERFRTEAKILIDEVSKPLSFDAIASRPFLIF